VESGSGRGLPKLLAGYETELFEVQDEAPEKVPPPREELLEVVVEYDPDEYTRGLAKA
jgi:hypothetical protein